MSEDVEASEETETETDTRKTVTVVVPVYNEAENIPHFVTAVDEAMAGLPYDYEILFVDDGSREESREVLRKTSRPTRMSVHSGFRATTDIRPR